MHHSDTLVLGPLPVVERSIRLPLTAVLIALLAVVLASGVVVAVLGRPRAIGLPLLGAQAVEPPVAADDIKWFSCIGVGGRAATASGQKGPGNPRQIARCQTASASRVHVHANTSR
jgi:hypothetical protein